MTKEAITVSLPQKLLTTREVAAILGIQPGTLNTWRATGRAPELVHCKIGRAVRYTPAAVENYLALRTKEHT